MKTIYKSIVIFIILSVQINAGSFKAIKNKLAQAECVEIDFLTILESSIFESVDSADGTALISNNGNYIIHLADDIYAKDEKYIYSYSPETEQVLMEKYDSENSNIDEIIFITQLDKYYHTKNTTDKNKFFLTKKNNYRGNLPDSMTVLINSELNLLEQINYFDVNDELNRIVINEIITKTCKESELIPEFPDSAERVKL